MVRLKGWVVLKGYNSEAKNHRCCYCARDAAAKLTGNAASWLRESLTPVFWNADSESHYSIQMVALNLIVVFK